MPSALRRVDIALLALSLSSAACSRDPYTTYARRLERLASWSASVQFTNEMARARYVPRAYVHDVLATAGRDAASIRQEIQKSTGVDAASRARDDEWCARLTAVVDAAAREGSLADDDRLRDIEVHLRESARAARSRAAGGTAR